MTIDTTINQALLDDVRSGLSLPQKSLPCIWFYDDRGSELFQQITHLPEYYLTRTEQAILDQHTQGLAQLLGPGAVIVEYGAGASIKTRTLLSALNAPTSYWPVDISADFVRDSADKIAKLYPDLTVKPWVGDFMSGGPDRTQFLDAQTVLGFFPGSTIGNLSDTDISAFLKTVRKQLGDGARFLIGADLKKEPSILVDAYDDAAGVTADFNMNVLVRINDELGANFDLEKFRHEARWNESASQIEMHLVSQCAQTVTVHDERFSFQKDETIHTENSRKFSVEALSELSAPAGWALEELWTDPDNLYGMLLMKAA
jgi:dimethylhistidine N-methyltransferase